MTRYHRLRLTALNNPQGHLTSQTRPTSTSASKVPSICSPNHQPYLLSRSGLLQSFLITLQLYNEAPTNLNLAERSCLLRPRSCSPPFLTNTGTRARGACSVDQAADKSLGPLFCNEVVTTSTSDSRSIRTFKRPPVLSASVHRSLTHAPDHLPRRSDLLISTPPPATSYPVPYPRRPNPRSSSDTLPTAAPYTRSKLLAHRPTSRWLITDIRATAARACPA